MRFQNVVGHQHIINHLQNAIKLNKTSHAYIMNGEPGSGKKLLSDIFSTALQCEKQGIEPCMECHSCKQVANRNQPDIIWVTHEKPNSIGVDDIRKINGDMMIKPYSSPFKIYIIDEAEKMTVQAQNAILKTMEEPPSYGIILLLTNNIDLFLPTIISRCVVLNLKPIEDSLIKKYLMEELKVPDYQAELSAGFAQGNMGKAIKLASSDSFNQIKEDALQLLKYIDEMEVYEIIDAIKRINDYKLEVQDYLDIFTIWYRDILLFKATSDINTLIFKDEVNFLIKKANKSSYEGIELILKGIEKAKIRLKANVNFDLVMELLLFTIKEN